MKSQTEGVAIPQLILLTAITLACLWIVGEAMDKPAIRRIAGPLFVAIVVAIAYGAAALRTSFDDSIRHSGATKDFVAALVNAIDRGDVDAAHAELRRFDAESIETYEGGAFLRWLREPVERLSTNGQAAVSPASEVTNAPSGG